MEIKYRKSFRKLHRDTQRRHRATQRKIIGCYERINPMATTFSRRDFMRMSAVLPALAAWPQWLPRLAFAPPDMAPRGDVLICIFLRGAADALNMIVPHGDDFYY